MKRQTVLTTLSLLFSILLITMCAVNPVTGKKQLMFMSMDQEASMGKEYDPQVMATFGEYKDQSILALIKKKGNEMGAISHRSNLEFHYRILDSPVINAFAVPGGYVYLTRGILAQFNNEAEMAGVIGHEMGHITARHTASAQSKQQLGQLLLIGGMMASEELRKYSDYAMQGMQLLFLSFSRENEREADRLGVEYSSKIGYDAHKMADFYKVLIKMNLADHAGIPTFMSTHPDPGDRYNSVNQSATAWQDSLHLPSYKVNSDNYLSLIDGMVFGEDPRQGYVEGQNFYHPELKFKFTFPSGWKLENSPIQVRMIPPDGKALIVFTTAPEKSLEDAVKATQEQLQLNIQESKRTTVNGMKAIATLSSQTSQDQSTGQNLTIKILSYFIDYNGNNYVFHGVSNDVNFNNYLNLFETTMLNFNKLTDQSKLNVQPKKIKIIKVQNQGTLADALQSLGIKQKQMEELAFLNDLELQDKVPAGKLIKIIVD
jgi:predicted Zn-dependent protease